MLPKKSDLPAINKASKEKRELDAICRHAEKLHGGKLVPIIHKESYKSAAKSDNSTETHIVKKMRIIEKVYGLNSHSNEEELMISYVQKRSQKPAPKPPPTEDTKITTITYNSQETNQFRGVIRHLTEKCGQNVHFAKVVNVTSSSICQEQKPNDEYPDPYHTIELDNISSSFASDYEPDAWICYDFQDRKVKPNAYSVRTYIYGPNHLTNWIIEGSNDSKSWISIDEQESNELFDNIGKSISFKIKPSPQIDFFRYLRLRLTGPTVTGKFILNVSALEYFGSLLGSDPLPSKEKKKKINVRQPSIPHPTSARRIRQ